MKTDHHISQLELINNVNSIFAKTNKGVDLKYSKILPDKIIIDSGFKDVPVKLISTDLLRVVLSNLIRLKVGSYFSVNDRYLKTKKRKPHQRRRYTQVRFSFNKKSKKKKKKRKKFGFFKWPGAPKWAFERFNRQSCKRSFVHYRGSIKWANVNLSKKLYQFVAKSVSNSHVSLFLNCYRFNRFGWCNKNARNLLVSNYASISFFKLKNPHKSAVIFPGFLMSNPFFKNIFIKVTKKQYSRLKLNKSSRYKIRLIKKQVKIISFYSNNFKPYNAANNKVDWTYFKKYYADYRNSKNKPKYSRAYRYFNKYKNFHKNFKIKPKTYNHRSFIFKFILSISCFLNTRLKSSEIKKTSTYNYMFNSTDLFTFSYNFLAIITQLSMAYKREGPYLRSFIKNVFPNISTKKKRLKFNYPGYRMRRRNPFISINSQGFQFYDLILMYGNRRTWDNFFYNSALTSEFINTVRIEIIRDFKILFFKDKLISNKTWGKKRTFNRIFKTVTPTDCVKKVVRQLLPYESYRMYRWISMHEFNSIARDLFIRNKPKSVKFHALNSFFNKFKFKYYLDSKFNFFSWFFNYKFKINRYKFNFLVRTKGKKFNVQFQNHKPTRNNKNFWNSVKFKDLNYRQKKVFKLTYKKYRIPSHYLKMFSRLRIKKYFNWRNFSVLNSFIRNEFALINSINQKNWRRQQFFKVFPRKMLRSSPRSLRKVKLSKFRFPSFFLLSFTKNIIFNKYFFDKYLNFKKLNFKKKVKHELIDEFICVFNQRKVYRRYRLNMFNSRKFDFNSSSLASFFPSYKEINFRTGSVFILSNILNDQVWIKPDIKHQFKLVLSGLYRNF